ncbi:MAG TPA: MFS transporter [Mycobacterium sp.]|nr:MFS transporter [Mycobacterium sp.]
MTSGRRRMLGGDAALIIAAQGLRAAGYGFTAVVLGALLAARGYGHLRAGLVLMALIAGTAVASLVVGAVADRVGRRRSYATFFMLIAISGALVASSTSFWLLLAIALTGALSTDVVDNGPATTLEQVMLANDDAGTASMYGVYNAAGAGAGALGALAATLPGLAGGSLHGWLFASLVPVGVGGVVLASRLTPAVEAGTAVGATGRRLTESRSVVRRLAALFAVDAAGGGLVTTGFLSYLFSERYGVSVIALGWLFFAVTLVQAVSVLIAPRLAKRFGLVATMVGTHLPSNVLLAAIAFAGSFPVAAVLLLARTTLSQMDVPTRQALVMSVVTPPERTAAAAVTNAARYTVRPVGPLVAGVAQQIALGAPLLVAGVVKGGYDLALWRWAHRLPLTQRRSGLSAASAPNPEAS